MGLHTAGMASQRGQALLEGVVVLTALLSLWIAIPWLSRLQHIALTAQHASSYAAFAASRSDVVDLDNSVRHQFFSGPAHQWRDRAGNRILAKLEDTVAIHLDQYEKLSLLGQPGGDHASAQTLRRDWQIHDKGVLSARVTVTPENTRDSNAEAVTSSRLAPLSAYPSLQRHTAILTGAGHSSDDAAVQKTIAQSALAWNAPATTSYGLGRRISSAMSAVDAGWQRTSPVFDWLSAWAGHVPAAHLSSDEWGLP